MGIFILVGGIAFAFFFTFVLCKISAISSRREEELFVKNWVQSRPGRETSGQEGRENTSLPPSSVNGKGAGL